MTESTKSYLLEAACRPSNSCQILYSRLFRNTTTNYNWLQADFDEYKATANQTISNLKAQIAKWNRAGKHVVEWVADHGPQVWIAEQANNLFKNLVK